MGELSAAAVALVWNGTGNVLQSLKRYDEALAAHAKAIALVMSENQSLKDGMEGLQL